VQINKARLQVLQARDQVLDEILEKARKHLRDASSTSASYQELLKVLVLQCLFRLMDEKVSIACRQADVELVGKAITYATAEYGKQAGTRVNVTVEEKYLHADCAGGVIVSSLNGKIKCDNTLETRLEYAFEVMLPVLRVRLFGNSPSRKFFD
jgi:V-type H+-transporting ATPase subunit E